MKDILIKIIALVYPEFSKEVEIAEISCDLDFRDFLSLRYEDNIYIGRFHVSIDGYNWYENNDKIEFLITGKVYHNIGRNLYSSDSYDNLRLLEKGNKILNESSFHPVEQFLIKKINGKLFVSYRKHLADSGTLYILKKVK